MKPVSWVSRRIILLGRRSGDTDGNFDPVSSEEPRLFMATNPGFDPGPPRCRGAVLIQLVGYVMASNLH